MLGFSEGGVGIARNAVYKETVPAEIQQLIDDVEEVKVISGEIVVSSAFGMDSEQLTSL